jgi:hypothetical protein
LLVCILPLILENYFYSLKCIISGASFFYY